MGRVSRIADWLLKSPILWGGLAALAFYAGLKTGGYSESGFMYRYFLGHPILVVTTVLFFVGMAELVIRSLSLFAQFSVFRQPLLPPIMLGGQPAEDAKSLLTELASAASYLQQTYLVRRLREALDHVSRKDSAEDIDERLKHLEEIDIARMSSSYALMRIIIWAIPILGFLGTVVGITMAIAELNPEALEKSLGIVTFNLGIAFDTTALSLALAMVLMFTKYFVERAEDKLLSAVDERAAQELSGRFRQYGSSTDPNVAAIRRMCDQVVLAVESMASRQAEVWRGTIEETQRQWAVSTTQTAAALEETLASGLRRNLRDHATGLVHGIEQQLGILNGGLQEQVRSLNQCVDDHLTSLTRRTTEDVQAIQAATARHVSQLDTEANRLVGNLGSGFQQLAEILVEGLQRHAEALTTAEQDLAANHQQHVAEMEAALAKAMVLAADRQEKLIAQSERALQEMQGTLVSVANSTVEHQAQLVRQGEVLLKVVGATNQVQQLEEALSQNLSSLGRAHNFEETLLSLSAAIQLLSARVGREQPRSGGPQLSHQAA